MFYDRRAQRAARRAYRRSMRGRRGIYGFPWFLLVLLIIFSHTFWALVVGVVVAIVLTAILLRVFGVQGMMGGTISSLHNSPITSHLISSRKTPISPRKSHLTNPMTRVISHHLRKHIRRVDSHIH